MAVDIPQDFSVVNPLHEIPVVHSLENRTLEYHRKRMIDPELAQPLYPFLTLVLPQESFFNSYFNSLKSCRLSYTNTNSSCRPMIARYFLAISYKTSGDSVTNEETPMETPLFLNHNLLLLTSWNCILNCLSRCTYQNIVWYQLNVRNAF